MHASVRVTSLNITVDGMKIEYVIRPCSANRAIARIRFLRSRDASLASSVAGLTWSTWGYDCFRHTSTMQISQLESDCLEKNRPGAPFGCMGYKISCDLRD